MKNYRSLLKPEMKHKALTLLADISNVWGYHSIVYMWDDLFHNEK